MRRIVFAPVLLAGSAVLALAAPVAAFPLTTCTLALASTDASGAPLDTATSGAADATRADPFQVDWEGMVSYQGTTGVVIKDYTYQISVFGVPTPLQGGGTNDDENTDGEGSVGVAANSPFRAAGLYHVTGTYSGAGGTCSGSGWFLLTGSPIGTVPWIAGVALTVIGALGLARGLGGHLLSSIAGGFVGGLGLDLLLISHAVLPLGEITPLVVLLAVLTLGVIVGAARRGGAGPAGA